MTGPMGAGKTTTMYNDMVKLSLDPTKSCLLVMSKHDDRVEKSLSTHDGFTGKVKPLKIPRNIDVVYVKSLKEVDSTKYTDIFIDEGQFIEDITIICGWKNNCTVSGLDWLLDPDNNLLPTDIQKFKGKKKVKYIELKAICHDCNKHEAVYSYRTTKSGKIIDIGGMNKYISVCRGCYQARKG